MHESLDRYAFSSRIRAHQRAATNLFMSIKALLVFCTLGIGFGGRTLLASPAMPTASGPWDALLDLNEQRKAHHCASSHRVVFAL